MSPPTLVDICIQAVASGKFWRSRRHTLQLLPEDHANQILQLLLKGNSLSAPELEAFRWCVTKAPLHILQGGVSQTWIAYISDFSNLRELDLSHCSKLRGPHLAPLQKLGPTLEVLSLKGCSQLSNRSLPHVLELTSLVYLNLAETNMAPPVAAHLTCLRHLTHLDLGALPTTDACCEALSTLPLLSHLVLWGSSVTSSCFLHLAPLTTLTFLDLSWSKVDSLAPVAVLPHLHTLVLQSCSLEDSSDLDWLLGQREAAQQLQQLSQQPGQASLQDGNSSGSTNEGSDGAAGGDGSEVLHLEVLNLAGCRVSERSGEVVGAVASAAAASLVELDLRATSFARVDLLSPATRLQRLTLSGCLVRDDDVLQLLTLTGLTSLSLAGTQVGWKGAALLPALAHLQELSLSNTPIDDIALGFLCRLSLLSSLDLSNTLTTGIPSPSPLLDPFPLPQSLTQYLSPTWASELNAEHFFVEREVPESGYGTSPVGGMQSGIRPSALGIVPVLAAAAAAADKGWATLKRLQRLNLEGSSAGDSCCKALANSSQIALTSLALGAPAGNSVFRYVAKITSLKSLTLKDCKVTDAGLDGLAFHPSLRELMVSNCWMLTRDAIARCISTLGSLEAAIVDGTPLQLQPLTPKRSSAKPQATVHALPVDERLRYTQPELLQVLDDMKRGQQGPLQAPHDLPVDLAKGGS